MIPIIALALAPLAPDAYVTGISVVPVGGQTEVAIEVQGEVNTTDFVLEGPARLVLDISGISQVSALQRRVDRGGVVAIRVAQFSPTVARVVLDLDQPVDYTVRRSGDLIRVSFPNPADEFEPWTAGPIEGLPVQVQAEPPPTAASAAGTQGPASAPVRQLQRPPITVAFNEEPLSSVLGAFAAYAGRSIVPQQDIKARLITAEVNNLDWEVALDAILTANNLVAREQESGVILVRDASTVREQIDLEPLVSRTYPIQYVAADSLLTAVRDALSGSGKANAVASGNQLLVTDTETNLARIEPLIQQLDVRPVQVTISATIAFVDRTALEQLGVIYDLKDSRGNQLNSTFPGENPVSAPGVAENADLILLSGSSVAALGNANYPVPSPALEVLTSLVLGRHTLLTFLQALQSVTLSDVQAKPVVTVMNHRQATIQVGQETPIRVLDAGAAAGGGGGGGGAGASSFPVATVEFKQTGIILNVTPHVTGDQILLDMRAERSDAIPASSDIGVVFTTQNATTQRLVNDGETALIGGLTVTDKSIVRTGIPILMDIPVLGKLFRNTRQQENKRDLLIMVTPNIIRD